MTCKDCIHYEVCISRITYDEIFGDTNKLNHNCDDFKDKSKLIELPSFNIGNIVYFIWVETEQKLFILKSLKIQSNIDLVFLANYMGVGLITYATTDKSKAEAKLKELNR